MNSVLRRARGILGIALTWLLVWAVAGGAYGAVNNVAHSRPGGVPAISQGGLISGVFYGLYGLICGLFFAFILAAMERRRAFEQPDTVRIAAWGALAGAAIPVALLVGSVLKWGRPLPVTWSLIAVGASLGATSGAASLMIARANSPVAARAVQTGRRLVAGGVAIATVVGLFIVGVRTGSAACWGFSHCVTDISDEPAAFTVDADALYAEFEANEETALDKYRKRVVVASGTVNYIGLGAHFVTIGGEGGIDGVHCLIYPRVQPAAESLAVGQFLRVKGIVTESRSGSVSLEDCLLQW